jgi:hypothetical protein
MRWDHGDVVVRREIWRGLPWLGTAVRIVEDDPSLLASYLPEGAPFSFPAGDWPTLPGRHPWHGRGAWEGHGVLMLQRPGESYAVWHFWEGPSRDFAGWYLNLQEPFRRTTAGYDTQDLELDVWVPASGGWSFKDDELLSERVREGRFSDTQAAEIRALGAAIGSMLDAGEEWWDPSWSAWEPDPDWEAPALPAGWEHAELLA